SEHRGKDFDVDLNIKIMSKSPLFEVRFTRSTMPLKLVMYDEKETYTSISLTPETDMPMLWSNNPNFVRIMVNQFDEFWASAEKFKAKKRERTTKTVDL
ncbi:MAG TPA: hypothetical protein VMD05_10370, partial [Candidatus Nanoarchaeia archaeon]|nr:hypothetical protein [Candidatus Nanoarchaeia archaeon]